MNVLCSSLDALQDPVPRDVRAFTFFEPSEVAGVGHIAQDWPRELKAQGYAPSIPAWDFVLFSFAVCAADLACLRKPTADSWTREISLSLTLNNPEPWTANAESIQRMLRVLTGDYWTLTFLDGGPPAPAGERELCDRDCVSLLSGGLDSLVGGIDLRAQGRQPVFVSQLAYEDSERQRRYAAELGGHQWHQQMSHGIVFNGRREPSTRARSMGFYALAVLATTVLQEPYADLYVPENGFISLNPPLLPGRMASFSTRTTHPLFMALLQQLLTNIGLGIRLKMPYRFKTKGQMLQECSDQALLTRLAADTTSCGRYRTYNRMHCGRCVPCMVRKGAFLAWDPSTDTTRYKFPNLRTAGKSSSEDDAMAAACAVLSSKAGGIDAFLGATLSFSADSERASFRGVALRGLAEIEALLARDGLV